MRVVKARLFVSAIASLLLVTGQAIAQNVPPATAATANGNLAGPVSLMSNREFWLSCVILVFGLFIVLVEFFLLHKVVENRTDEIAKIYTVTLIIIGTLVLIASGFTNEQIAPALGLFGTIAGYLLGRGEAKRPETKSVPGEGDK